MMKPRGNILWFWDRFPFMAIAYMAVGVWLLYLGVWQIQVVWVVAVTLLTVVPGVMSYYLPENTERNP